MSMGLKPIDVIMSVIPSLTDKEKEQVREALSGGASSKCDREGQHKYKVAEKIEGGLFSPSKVKVFCERCGKRLTM